MKTISLEFEGYWRNPDGIPDQSGIYCVYVGIVNTENKLKEILRLLYIGESKDVRERLKNHDRLTDWKEELYSDDEVLCYTFAPISSNDRERAEAALIYEHQPPMNEEHINQFIYPDTEIHVSGKTGNGKLKKNFIVFNDSE